MVELGSGPGFYACEFARRFPQISVLGIDQSEQQLHWARRKAERLELKNCHFEKMNVLERVRPDESFDLLLASRLFTVLPDRHRAVAEMFRVLKRGGRCLVAEPRFAFWASLPLGALWLIARLTNSAHGYLEPGAAITMSPAEFSALFASQPWAQRRTWQDGRYQYALCEKG